jgi:hypothetical protein
MNQRKTICRVMLAAVGWALLAPAAQALPFIYKETDLCLGFRKTGNFAGNNEVIVDLGSVTNYVNYAAGSTTTITNYAASQLSPDSFTSLNNLNWSVTAYVNANNIPGYARNTVWVTVPRSTVGAQSVPPTRLDASLQQSMVSYISSMFVGASDISTRLSANADNTSDFVQEPLNLPNITDGENYGAYMGGIEDSTQGTLQDSWIENNLEIITPSSFTSAVQSDLYEVRPNGVVDPHTGQTSGAAYYVGYFQLSPSGTMSFTRATVSTNPIVVPPPVLSITRTGNSSTISFATTNGATYTLYFTNSAGLTAPVSAWPTVSGTLSGNGSTESFTDTTTDTTRFYQVSGH